MDNKYDELIARQQKEYSEANLVGFAYGEKQFRTLMEQWGINPDDEKELKKVSHVYAGGYILVENIPEYKELLKRQQAEFDAAVAADKTGDGFIYEMFLSELNNHEFGYTRDTEDTLTALGYTVDEVMSSPQLKHGLEKAAGEIIRFEEEEDMEESKVNVEEQDVQQQQEQAREIEEQEMTDAVVSHRRR